MRTWMLDRLSARRVLFCGACVAALTVVACAGSSGGGRDSDGGESEGIAPTGQAMNRYLVGARVCVDLNLNGRCDASEVSARTQFGSPNNGRFVLDTGNTGSSLLVVAREGWTEQYEPGAGEGEGTPVDGDFELVAPAGAATVTPLTTLIHADYVDRINALGEFTPDRRVAAREAARNSVEDDLDDLGLGGFNILNEDYLAAGNANVRDTASAVGRILRAAVADTRNAISVDQDPDDFTRGAIVQYAAERVRENLPGIGAGVASGASVGNVVGNNQPRIQAGDGVIEAVQAAQDKLARAASRLEGIDDDDDDDDDDIGDVTGGTGGGGGGR